MEFKRLPRPSSFTPAITKFFSNDMYHFPLYRVSHATDQTSYEFGRACTVYIAAIFRFRVTTGRHTDQFLYRTTRPIEGRPSSTYIEWRSRSTRVTKNRNGVSSEEMIGPLFSLSTVEFVTRGETVAYESQLLPGFRGMAFVHPRGGSCCRVVRYVTLVQLRHTCFTLTRPIIGRSSVTKTG